MSRVMWCAEQLPPSMISLLGGALENFDFAEAKLLAATARESLSAQSESV